MLLVALGIPLPTLANFAEREDVQTFIREMEREHGLPAQELRQSLATITPNQRVLRLIRPPSQPAARSWAAYRDRFIEPQRINTGLVFWQENAATLQRAAEQYGVPEEIIVAIIGVETSYGRNTGNFQVMEALATLAFDYPPRAELFRRELENLFLLAREQGRSPVSYTGSFAGAWGYPQFLPSSVRHYAVDFSGDGKIDFESDAVDAIGSVANFLVAHGWQPGGVIAAQVAPPAQGDLAPLLEAGILPSIDAARAAAQGLRPLPSNRQTSDTLHDAKAALIEFPTPGQRSEYWLGYQNFYVITRYNRSSFYAMSVYALAEALRQRR